MAYGFGADLHLRHVIAVSKVIVVCSSGQGILTYFALGRFRRGVQEVAIPTYVEPPPDHSTPYTPTYAPTSYNPTTYIPTTYTAYPSSVPDMHPQPPVASNLQPQGDATYQPPVY